MRFSALIDDSIKTTTFNSATPTNSSSTVNKQENDSSNDELITLTNENILTLIDNIEYVSLMTEPSLFFALIVNLKANVKKDETSGVFTYIDNNTDKIDLTLPIVYIADSSAQDIKNKLISKLGPKHVHYDLDTLNNNRQRRIFNIFEKQFILIKTPFIALNDLISDRLQKIFLIHGCDSIVDYELKIINGNKFSVNVTGTKIMIEIDTSKMTNTVEMLKKHELTELYAGIMLPLAQLMLDGIININLPLDTVDPFLISFFSFVSTFRFKFTIPIIEDFVPDDDSTSETAEQMDLMGFEGDQTKLLTGEPSSSTEIPSTTEPEKSNPSPVSEASTIGSSISILENDDDIKKNAQDQKVLIDTLYKKIALLEHEKEKSSSLGLKFTTQLDELNKLSMEKESNYKLRIDELTQINNTLMEKDNDHLLKIQELTKINDTLIKQKNQLNKENDQLARENANLHAQLDISGAEKELLDNALSTSNKRDTSEFGTNVNATACSTILKLYSTYTQQPLEAIDTDGFINTFKHSLPLYVFTPQQQYLFNKIFNVINDMKMELLSFDSARTLGINYIRAIFNDTMQPEKNLKHDRYCSDDDEDNRFVRVE